MIQAGLDVWVLSSLAWLHEILCLVDISRLFFPEHFDSHMSCNRRKTFSILHLFYTNYQL